MIKLTAKQVRSAVLEFVDNIKYDYRNGQYDATTHRDTILERMNEDLDHRIWSKLVKNGQLHQYDVEDMLETAQACLTIINVAKQDAWVEDDNGLWQGCSYGVFAIIAFYSLHNLLYTALKKAGADTNTKYPFANVKWKKKK